MALIGEVVGLLIALVILYILYLLLKNGLHLIANAVMGIILFWIINMFLVKDVVIDFFSIAIVALAGIPGVLLVLIIHFLGLGF